MAQTPALMQKAQARAGEFKRPDIAPFTPPDVKDAVARIVAAGMKVMYSPAMRDELKAEVQREAPIPQKLAEGVVGLMLTLDQQSKGGLPVRAMFPAALELMSEGAEMLQAAGQTVTQEDYAEAVRMVIVLIAQKLGAKDPQQVMSGLQQGMPQGMMEDDEEEPSEAPEPPEQEGQPEPPEEEEDAAMPPGQVPLAQRKRPGVMR